MPWIAVTSGRTLDAATATALADGVAAAAGYALGLTPAGIIVLVHAIAGASGAGALVQIAGRDRGPSEEQALAGAVRDAVARALQVPHDLVGIVRLA